MKTRLALLLAVLALAGCADNNASVRISAICSAPTDAKACTFGATCGNQYIGVNAMDVAVTNRYFLVVQVDNQTAKNDNLGTFRANTADAFVQELEVEFVGAALPTTRGPVPGSAVVPAGGTAVISVEPINETIGNALAGAAIPAGGYLDLVAKLRLRGVYADTTKFETGVFQVPIRICNGCVGALTCTTAGDVPFYCPSKGQAPASATCAAP